MNKIDANNLLHTLVNINLAYKTGPRLLQNQLKK